MAQPWAIYASIPAVTGANWLMNPGCFSPVKVAAPYPFWPSVDWSDSNIAPSSGYGEIPRYLWSVPVPDPGDNAPKTFTRRLVANAELPLPNILQFPTGTGYFRFVFSITADDLYSFRLLINEQPIPGDAPSAGFWLTLPAEESWRKVKTYAFGTGVEPALIHDGDALDIQTTVTNLPLASGDNPAMVTWTLQMFLA